MQYFEKQYEQTLLRLLDQVPMQDAVLNYSQIQGLLFAMACAPEPIDPTEWFPLVWLDSQPLFEDAQQTGIFYKLLVDLFDAISAQVESDQFRLHGWVQNSAIADWCDGFLIGHEYLEEIWEVTLESLDDDQLFERVGAALDCAIAFIDGAANEWDDEELFRSELIRLQQLLQDYREVYMRSRTITAVTAGSAERLFFAMEPLAPDAPCCCGSGRPFKRCCLH